MPPTRVRTMLLFLLVASTAAFVVKKRDGIRTANHVIKDCIHMTSEEGHYFYKAASEDATVCGIYFVAEPNMLIQIHFDYLDVPCASGGLLAFVDGWELNGGYFPSPDEHELPLSERVSEFCGLAPPARTFLSSQNAALLQYRVPKRSRGFSFKVSFVKNPAHRMPLPVSANFPKFKTEELYAFIKEYKKHRMLYDFDHPLYTNYVERTKRFMLISKALKIDGLTPDRVRAKIKVFRGNYTHRLKEMYKKMKTGEEFQAPTWWYMADKFLRPHIRFLDPDVADSLPPMKNPRLEAGGYCSSEEPASPSNEDEGKDAKDNAEESTDHQIYLELDEDQLMAIENGEMSIEEVAAQAEEAAKLQGRSVSRRMVEDEVADQDETMSQLSGGENTDEFDAFGRCVALQLKTLPLDAALELETQIHSLITKQRLAHIRQTAGC